MRKALPASSPVLPRAAVSARTASVDVALASGITSISELPRRSISWMMPIKRATLLARSVTISRFEPLTMARLALAGISGRNTATICVAGTVLDGDDLRDHFIRSWSSPGR